VATNGVALIALASISRTLITSKNSRMHIKQG
jgi:hypothetical protein